MSKIKLFLIVFLFAGCSVPDFMIQGQLDDFERALEEEDVNWIMDQFTDDVVRELPDGVKLKRARMSCECFGKISFNLWII